MKTFLISLVSVISLCSFAGNGGGTMAATNGKTIQGGSVGTMKTVDGSTSGGVLGRPQIIFNMGQKNGLVKYAHGQVQNGEWVVNEFVDSMDSVIENSEFVKALSESQMKRDWVELK